MHPLILAVLLGAQPDKPATRITFETLTREDAERLHGKTVVTTFTVATQSYTWGAGANQRILIGARGTGEIERTAVLKGNRRDADRGTRVTVVGTLRVIWHPPATINDKEFAGFNEARIEETDTVPTITSLVAFGVPARPGDTASLVKFDTITLKDAERLDGAAVAIRFTVATPATTYGEGANLRTIVGAADRNDGAEWTVFLKGNRLSDADDGRNSP